MSNRSPSDRKLVVKCLSRQRPKEPLQHRNVYVPDVEPSIDATLTEKHPWRPVLGERSVPDPQVPGEVHRRPLAACEQGGEVAVATLLCEFLCQQNHLAEQRITGKERRVVAVGVR